MCSGSMAIAGCCVCLGNEKVVALRLLFQRAQSSESPAALAAAKDSWAKGSTRVARSSRH